MANYNHVCMIGRITRDPEERKFASGSGMVSLGFCTNNRRKNQSTGQWEDEPMFIDCKVFGKSVDAIMQFVKKGSQILIEGHLSLETWEDKNGGGRRSKHVIIVDRHQFLDNRQRYESAPRQQQQESAAPNLDPPPPGPGDENIPF